MTDHVVLIGLMGAGKTTVGRELAARLGTPWVDTDRVVEERSRRSIPEIFADDGEAGFRSLESEALRDACEGPAAVISCGGGALVDEANREMIASRATVLWLRAPTDALARRVSSSGARPLLAGKQVVDELELLSGQRRAAYRSSASAVLDASRSVADVVGQACAALSARADSQTRIVAVDDPEHPYEVVIGSRASAALVERLSTRRRVGLVTQLPLEPVAAGIRAALTERGVTTETFLIDDGEQVKRLETIEDLTERWADWGLARSDVAVAVGGGVVGDTAGFAAATYHRGVDVAQVPTTLLAMVDSAIGAKTGVNLSRGKNLVGAFHAPIGVFSDPSVLATLPDAEFRSGLGEVVKYALLGDEELASTLRASSREIAARDPDALAAVVHLCARAKAEAVGADPMERSGVRARLNLGHTLAHALEAASGFDLRHGEAVAVGLVFAAELAGALERISSTEVTGQRELVELLGLPSVAPPGLRADDLLELMRRDKKAAGGLTFVLCGGAGVERVDDPSPTALEHAFASIGVKS